MFPHLFQHWLTAKSASSFKLPVVAHPIFIMIVWAPCVLIGVWATTELASVPASISPNGVLAFLVRTKTGNVLGGFLTAGVLAAIMSSLDSQFLCLGTMFTNDIALHYSKGISDRQRVITARIFVIVIVIVTYLFSLAEPRRVFQMGVWCFSGFSALFPLVIAALYWRRLTLAGAYAGILAAMASWGYLFWQSKFGLIPNYSVDIKLGGEVYPTMPVATILLCSLVAMVGVSLVTRPPDKKTLDLFFPSEEQ
jgi:SSS family solute:Na+ symporter